MFSVITWAQPLLPDIDGLTWRPDWPDDFDTMPRGSFREADNSTGIITTEGEGSALVSLYVDIWVRTPEEREEAKKAISDAFVKAGMNRGMSRDTVEIWVSGTKAFRSTLLFRGEWDYFKGRMCRP